MMKYTRIIYPNYSVYECLLIRKNEISTKYLSCHEITKIKIYNLLCQMHEMSTTLVATP